MFPSLELIEIIEQSLFNLVFLRQKAENASQSLVIFLASSYPVTECTVLSVSSASCARNEVDKIETNSFKPSQNH